MRIFLFIFFICCNAYGSGHLGFQDYVNMYCTDGIPVIGKSDVRYYQMTPELEGTWYDIETSAPRADAWFVYDESKEVYISRKTDYFKIADNVLTGAFPYFTDMILRDKRGKIYGRTEISRYGAIVNYLVESERGKGLGTAAMATIAKMIDDLKMGGRVGYAVNPEIENFEPLEDWAITSYVKVTNFASIGKNIKSGWYPLGMCPPKKYGESPVIEFVYPPIEAGVFNYAQEEYGYTDLTLLLSDDDRVIVSDLCSRDEVTRAEATAYFERRVMDFDQTGERASDS